MQTLPNSQKLAAREHYMNLNWSLDHFYCSPKQTPYQLAENSQQPIALVPSRKITRLLPTSVDLPGLNILHKQNPITWLSWNFNIIYILNVCVYSSWHLWFKRNESTMIWQVFVHPWESQFPLPPTRTHGPRWRSRHKLLLPSCRCPNCESSVDNTRLSKLGLCVIGFNCYCHPQKPATSDSAWV